MPEKGDRSNESSNEQKKKALIALLAAAFLALAALVLVMLFSRFEQRHEAVPAGAGLSVSRTEQEAPAAESMAAGDGDISLDDDSVILNTLYYNGRQYVYNDALTTLLVLGVDDDALVETASSRNTSQADFLMLAVFDSESRQCTMIQLNRDTMTDVPALDTFGNVIGLRNEQLALAHTYGNGLEKSCENTVDAVSRLLYGIEIDNYFALTMDAIPVLNDLVGGVTVTVEDDFSDTDPTLIQGETVMLTAENVEHYVRMRTNVGDGTNLARMRRQKEYLTGMLASLKRASEEDSSFVLKAYSAVASSLVTDCTIEELSAYEESFSNYTTTEILMPEGETVMGEKFMEFYVDETALQQLVIDTFYVDVTQ